MDGALEHHLNRKRSQIFYKDIHDAGTFTYASIIRDFERPQVDLGQPEGLEIQPALVPHGLGDRPVEDLDLDHGGRRLGVVVNTGTKRP